MPPQSQFAPSKQPVIPNARTSDPIVRVDLRGLDMSSPYDVMAKNRTPHARNFRIYAEEADDRRVTVRSRKGSGFYTNPQGEGIYDSFTSTTGADTVAIDVITDWKADTFTPSVTGPLTRLGLKMKSNGATGSIIVEIREDNSGAPGNLIAKSGILGSDVSSTLGYVNVRFIEAPYLTASQPYWYILRMQADGTGQYLLATTTARTTALTSNTAGLSWASTTYGLNFNAYVTTDVRTKGVTRYAPTNGINKTIAYIGNNLYTVNDITGNLSSIKSGLNAAGEKGYFTYADDKAFFVNGYDDVQMYDGTSVTTLTHSQLPILRLATFHHNRLFGVDADDPNRLVFSEDPGNDDGDGNEWYAGWLSTSFIYIPTPKASEPITAIIPFQDNLVVFTKNSKYTLYGTDPGTFTVRQATGKKGAASQNAVYADENYIYFASDDGFYRFNGSEDEIISDMTSKDGGSVQPEFDNIADPGEVFIAKWKRVVRFYYPVKGSSFNSRCLLFHTVFQEWMMDTDAQVSHAVHWNDSQDDNQLMEASSTAPTFYFAEVDDNNLGKGIDFVYDCPYDSMGNPAIRKRIVKLFPLLEGEGTNYSIQVGVDRDRQNTPRLTDIPLTVGGALIGQFNIGDGTVIGGINQFKPTRVRVPGYAYYWQIRVAHEGINNPVQFVGYVVSIRAKRL